MLGKLIKYDMKALNRFLVIIHCFLLLLAALIRIFITGRIYNLESEENGILLLLFFILYLILVVGVSIGTFIIIGARFYTNLFSDEGYLTRTLPVTSGRHLLSKTIAGCIWGYIDTILILAATYFTIFTPAVREAYVQNRGEILNILGFTEQYVDTHVSTLVLSLLFLLLVDTLAKIITLYASIVLGQLFSGHRVLGAVVAYFALNTVISIISFAALVPLGYFSNTFLIATSDTLSYSPSGFLSDSLKVSIVFSLVVAVILYLTSYQIMKKKIDLI